MILYYVMLYYVMLYYTYLLYYAAPGEFSKYCPRSCGLCRSPYIIELYYVIL